MPIPPCFPSTLGTPFYLMEHCAGRVYRDVSLPALQPSQRRAIYAAMSQVLSKIHSVDLRAAKLEDLGEHGERRLCILYHCFLLQCITMHLLCISFEASLCQSLSLRAFIPLLQVITFSGKFRPGQSSIKLWKVMLSQRWKDSLSGCLCIFLNIRRRQLCMVISGTAWLTALPWSTSQAVERERECKAVCRLQRDAELGWHSSFIAV